MYNNLTYFFYNKCNLQWMNKTRRAALLFYMYPDLLLMLPKFWTSLTA
jgi:hypothetical protein